MTLSHPRRLSELLPGQKTSHEMTDDELNGADWQDGYDAMVEASRELLADHERLREALRPFVELARHHAVDAPEWRDKDSVSAVVSIGDLRRAALEGR